MKGFYRYLPPFAPDYSGAVSALFNAGGLVVLCDPGGCSGNVAGYDEPRFYGSHSAFFSAAIREIDSILGRDDKLEQKVIAAAKMGHYDFIALIGTPVVSVIGTDLTAIAHRIEAQTGIPSFGVATTGMEDYSVGEEAALLAFAKKFGGNGQEVTGRIGVIGATPLNAVGNDDLVSIMRETLGDKVVFFSERDAIKVMSNAGSLTKIISVSASGMAVGKLFEQRFKVPFEVKYPQSDAIAQTAKQLMGAKKILVVHHQTAANALRQVVEKESNAKVKVGTFFRFDQSLARQGDMAFGGEDELSTAANDCDAVAIDPMYVKALPDFKGTIIPFVHQAMSGDLYQ